MWWASYDEGDGHLTQHALLSPVSHPSQEDETTSSSSEEEEADQRLNEELLGKVVCVESVAPGDRKRTAWYPAVVRCPPERGRRPVSSCAGRS